MTEQVRMGGSRPRAPERAAVYRRGAVSAGSAPAAQTALAVLQQGGNAMDAALAAAAVQAVAEFPWCGLGGDAFALVYTPSEGVMAVNGSGAAPLGIAAVDLPQGKAPRFGPLSVAVPGMAGAWDLVAARFASWPRADLLAPAIRLAREGLAVYPRLAAALARLDGAAGPALQAFLAQAGVPSAPVLRQPALAEALATLAAGAAAFYRGWPGRAIAAAIQARGGVLAAEDLAAHRTGWQAPLVTTYRGHTIYEQPPVSLGCILLEELRLLEGFSLEGVAPGDPALIDLMVRCKQAAFADAQRRLGDPAEGDLEIEALLSEAHLATRRRQIAATASPAPADALPLGADTTSLVVADAEGRLVCWIQSLFNEFGSREYVTEAGILLNDRLANLVADPDAPNGLRGGRRPLHTLNTYLVCREGTPLYAGATPGGRGQVQINFQVLVNLIDFGLDPRTAVALPRWVSGAPYRGPHDDTLYLEAAFPEATAAALRRRGHTVERLPPGASDIFGGCTLLARHPAGGWIPVADPRRGAQAAGW